MREGTWTPTVLTALVLVAATACQPTAADTDGEG